eukprot:TRINITY_DN31654_c0_g1_i1.p1 TRINITY_DN31654_c0_g1~~TRINITY_DN31654_c0_g1_i1.p1  ORF type:complete len:890 (+),score=180.17 TRINITY_DN31654_c0_g1_i1:69-2738(+)
MPPPKFYMTLFFSIIGWYCCARIYGARFAEKKPIHTDVRDALAKGISDHPANAEQEKRALSSGRIFGDHVGWDLDQRMSVDDLRKLTAVPANADGLLGPRDMPHGHCVLEKEGLEFSFDKKSSRPSADNPMQVIGFDANLIFLANEYAGEDFASLIALLVICDESGSCEPNTQELHIVFFGDDASAMMSPEDLKTRLKESFSRIVTKPEDSALLDLVLGSFHVLTTPIDAIESKSCWLPHVVELWTDLRGDFQIEGGNASTEDRFSMEGNVNSVQGEWAPSRSQGMEKSVKGPLRWFGHACDEAEPELPNWPAPESDIKGAVALISRGGGCSFYHKARRAQEQGAVGVVIYNTDNQDMTLGCSEPDPCNEVLDVLVIMISKKDGDNLRARLYDKERRLDVTAHLQLRKTRPRQIALQSDGGGLRTFGSSYGLEGTANQVKGMQYEQRVFYHRASLETAPEEHSKVIKVLDRQLFNDHSLLIPLTPEIISAFTEGWYDQLQMELHLDCGEHSRHSKCFAWDQIMNLYSCDEGQKCRDHQKELGRWITPYGREGRWLSNNSAALPNFGSLILEKPQSLHLYCYLCSHEEPYSVTLYFLFQRFSPKHEAKRGPLLKRQSLWGQESEPFDAGFNVRHDPIRVDVPNKGFSRVILSALLTGHGWGKEAKNCAEFCYHTHHFTINGGDELKIDHPWVKQGDGCERQIDKGTVPNQYGTWNAGRAGWCTGKHVDWWEWDVTDFFTGNRSGQNTINYVALVDGEPYKPENAPSWVADPGGGNGFSAELHYTTALTFYDSPAKAPQTRPTKSKPEQKETKKSEANVPADSSGSRVQEDSQGTAAPKTAKVVRKTEVTHISSGKEGIDVKKVVETKHITLKAPPKTSLPEAQRLVESFA